MIKAQDEDKTFVLGDLSEGFVRGANLLMMLIGKYFESR